MTDGAREADGVAAATRLSDAQIERYARHILLREVGGRGQARLLAGAVRVAGDGRAAEEAAVYLVAAGVGRIGLEATLSARLGGHLGAMNPDVLIMGTDQAGADAAVVAAAGEDRGAGALAALEALMVLAGVREAKAWEYST